MNFKGPRMKYLQYIFLIFWFFSVAHPAFANNGEESGQSRQKSVEWEVNVKPSSMEDLEENKPSRITKKSALKMHELAFMNNISNLDIQDQQIIHRQAMGSARMRLIQQIRGFAPEALVFYAAIGATMVRKAYTDQLMSGRRDPAWLENLANEITSPLGVFSFFCFLIASGQTSYWLSQPLKPWSQALVRQQQKSQAKARVQKKSWIFRGTKTKRKHSSSHPKLRTPFWNTYKISRMGFRQTAGLINQTGLAAGILASNIVTEMGFLINNPSVNYCANQLLPDQFANHQNKLSYQNGVLVCDSAFEELMATFKSWGPDILSVIVAGFINHALTQGLFTIKQIGTGGVKLFRNVVAKRVTPLHQQLLRMSMLIPTGPGQIRRVMAVTGHWTFRFFNLYTFMEIAELTGHHLFHGWNENIKANDLSDSIVSMAQNFNPHSNQTGLNCSNKPSDISEDNSAKCSYHPTIRTAIQVGNSFKRWRQFQSLPIEMGKQNWLHYISNTLTYFDTSANIYQNFFLSRQMPTLFNKTHYFGPLFDDIDIESSDSFISSKTNKLSKDIQTIFLNMAQKIKSYNVNNPIPPSPLTLSQLFQKIFKTEQKAPPNKPNLPLQIVSSISDSKFIRPIKLDPAIEINLTIDFLSSKPIRRQKTIEISDKHTQLSVLQKMFSVADPSVPIISFYKHWNIELQKTKNWILQTETQQIKSRCDQAVNFTKTIKQLIQSGSIQPSNEINHYLDAQKKILNQCMDIKQSITSNRSTTRLGKKEELITQKEAQIFIRKYYQKDPDLWLKKAMYVLRNKVLAGGIQLLTQIVEFQLKKIIYQPHKLSTEDNQYIEELQEKGYPSELISTLQRLGPSHILAQLYQEIYRPDPTTGHYLNHIKPSAKGMLAVQSLNKHYKAKKEYFRNSEHPYHMSVFKTPGVMDFLIVSALCGPNLNNNTAHQNILPKIKKVLTGQNSIEEIFPNQTMDEIVKQMPVFSQSFTGNVPFKWQPPKILGLGRHKKDIKKICETHLSKINTDSEQLNIYNGTWVVNNQIYNNLLHVVLENILSEVFPTTKDFENWWGQQVKPYRDMFVLLANREYEQLTKHWFVPLLFQNQSTAVDIEYSPTENNHNSLFKIEQIFPTSSKEGWFQTTDTSHTEYSKSHISYKEGAVFNFSKGLFQNIHQEMHYWTDIILNLSKQSKDSLQIEDNLHNLLKLFYLPENYWEEKTNNSLTDSIKSFFSLEPVQITTQSNNKYAQWVSQFLPEDNRETDYLMKSNNICEWDNHQYDSLNKMQKAYLYIHISACLLNINMAALEENRNASQMAVKDSDKSISEEQFTKSNDRQIGFFYSGEKQLANHQLLNYAFIALKNLLLESSNYMDTIYSLSQSPIAKSMSQFTLPNDHSDI